MVFVAGFINRLSGMFMVNPQIKTPPELKGKSIAVNSLSGGGWIFSMLMLDYWGLSPERDKIQFRTLGEQAVMAQGVMSGTADAAFLGYTFGKMLQGKGFRVLADSEKLPIPYQGSGVMAKRSFIHAAPATLENVLRALLDSAAFIRNPENKAQVTRALARALRFKRVEDAEDGYQSMVNLYERKIYPSVEGIRNVIRLLGANNEKFVALRLKIWSTIVPFEKWRKRGGFDFGIGFKKSGGCVIEEAPTSIGITQNSKGNFRPGDLQWLFKNRYHEYRRDGISLGEAAQKPRRGSANLRPGPR